MARVTRLLPVRHDCADQYNRAVVRHSRVIIGQQGRSQGNSSQPSFSEKYSELKLQCRHEVVVVKSDKSKGCNPEPTLTPEANQCHTSGSAGAVQQKTRQRGVTVNEPVCLKQQVNS